MLIIKKIKDKIWYLNGRLLSNPHYVEETDTLIDAHDDQIKFFADTPNTIIYFKMDDKEGYFRECRQHVAPRAYLKKILDDYCKYSYITENSFECRELLEKKLSDPKCFNRFFNMGAGTADYAPINQYRHHLDSTVVGLPEPYPQWFKQQILKLLQFAWGPLDEYKYNAFVKKNGYHVFSANKSIVTKIIADEIGASHIIPKTYYAWLQLHEEKRFGVVVEPSPGCSPYELNSEYKVTGRAQRDLMLLNILDVICYQKDHRPGNYFVYCDDKNVIGISAFDNDCPTTLLPTTNIKFSTYIGCSPIIDKDGIINRPFIDKLLYEKILSLTKKYLQSKLKGQISKIQFGALWTRVHSLQVALKKSVSSKKCKLLELNQWNDETIKIELQEQYGMTYLKYLLLNCCKGEK